MTWTQAFSGQPVSFLAPDATNIELEDIAIALSRIPRFNGATRFPYSVAQHSVHVMQTVKEASPADAAAHLWGLMHDAHEAYTGDATTPYQQAIEAELPTGWPSPIKRIQERLDRAIAQRFGIDWVDVGAVKPLVKRADIIACSTEKAQLMAKTPAGWDWPAMPEPCEIELQQISAANAEWLFRFNFERCLAAYQQSKVKLLEAAE